MPNTFYSKCNRVIRPIIWFAHSCLNDDSFFCVTNSYYSGNVCLWCYLLTNPFSCLETAMGRRKYHRGKRVRITGVQWCLSQVGRIIANFLKSHSSDCKRNVEQTIHPPWYSNDLIEFPVYHQWNIKVSVHPHTGKSLRADFRFLPWNRSVVFIQQVNSMNWTYIV